MAGVVWLVIVYVIGLHVVSSVGQSLTNQSEMLPKPPFTPPPPPVFNLISYCSPEFNMDSISLDGCSSCRDRYGN